MGHAGEIIGGAADTADAKIAALRAAGALETAPSPEAAAGGDLRPRRAGILAMVAAAGGTTEPTR